jgi:PST family polysaccharide transporter
VAAPQDAAASREAASNRHLDTKHLRSDLRQRSVRGGVSMMGAQAARFVLQTGATVVLARLLMPADFGLVAMVATVTGFMSIFKDLGLSMATIQRAEISHAQVTGLFWINVAASLVLAVVAAVLAPAIVWFYGEPRLLEITFVLAGGFILGGLTTQHEALLKRQMRFRVLAALEVLSILIGTGAAIAAALHGAGYWALVIMQMGRPLVLLVGVWVACGWRPGGPQRARDVRELLSFGGNLTGHSIMNYFARNADYVLIGRYVGASALGFYEKAYQLLLLPLRQISTPLASVMVPALSRVADEPATYRRTFRRTLEKMAMLMIPMTASFMVLADWIVALVLGPKWTPAAELFMILGGVGLVQPVTNATGWLFISQDRTHEMLRWGVVGGMLTVLSFVAGLPWGVEGVALAYAGAGLVLKTPLLLWYVGRRGPVHVSDLYGVIALPAGAAAVVATGLVGMRHALPALTPLAGLALAAPFAIGLTLLIYVTVPRGRQGLRDGLTLLHDLTR